MLTGLLVLWLWANKPGKYRITAFAPFLLVGDLLSELNTNPIGALMSPITGLIGNWTAVIVTVILLIPSINRVGPEPVIIMSILSWVVFVQLLPAGALNLLMAIMVTGGAGILTVLFFSRRRNLP